MSSSSNGITLQFFLNKGAFYIFLASAFFAVAIFNSPDFAQAAAISKIINFQGKLTTITGANPGTNVVDGTYAMQFKIYDSLTAGTLLYTETYDQPSGACTKVSVTNGVFNVKLGSCNPLTGVDFTTGSLYISVNFAPSGTSYDGEMVPRKQLNAVAYAFSANNLGGDGRIDLAYAPADAINPVEKIAYNPSVASSNNALSVSANSNVSGAALIVTQAGTGTGLQLAGAGTNARVIQSDSSALILRTTTSGNITLDPQSGIVAGAGALTLRSGGATVMAVDAGGASALNLGTTNATSVVLGRASQSLQIKSLVSTAANGVLYLSDTSGTVAETAASTGAQCLQTASSGAVPAWGSCGGSSSPFTSTAGIITQTTSTDALNLVEGQTGDYGLRVNTSVEPTVDLVQIDNTNAIAATSNISDLKVTLRTATGAGFENSAINSVLNNAPVDLGDIMNGLRLDGPTTATIGTAVNGIELINSGWTTGINIEDSSGGVAINSPFGGFGRFENKLLYSEQFDQIGSWAATNTTVTANDAPSNPAPDGNTTADKLVSTLAGGSVKQSYTTSTTGNYIFSVWLKTNSGTQSADLRIDTTGSGGVTGTVKTISATTNWKRYFVSQNVPISIITAAVVNIFPGGTSGTGTIVAWGAQLEQQTTVGVYAATAASLQNNTNNSTVYRGLVANNGLKINTQVAPVTDIVTIANRGLPIVTAGTSALQIDYEGGSTNSVGFESSAQRIDLKPGTITGNTAVWNGLRFVANTTGPTASVTETGIKLEAPTAGGAGTFNGFNIIGLLPGAAGTTNGVNISTAALTESGANTDTVVGLTLSSAGALIVNTNASANISWKGLQVTMPAITQTTGSVNATGLEIAMSTLTTGGSYRAINILDASSNSIFEVKDTSTANNNFGGLVMSGALISRDSYWSEEYNAFRTAWASAITTTINDDRCRGDLGGSYSATSCTTGTGEMSFSAVLGVAASTNSCRAASSGGINGYETITATSSATASNTAACLEYIGAGAAAANKPFAANNLPVVVMKVRPSLVNSGSNARFFVGLGDKVAANGQMPSNGVFFTNCTVFAGTTCTSATWQGTVTVGGAIVGTQQACTAGVETGTIDTTSFNYLRIEVRSNTDIHFYVDTNTSTGVVETECGTGFAGTGPAATALGVNLESAFMTNSATAEALDIDYVRIWQDDAAVTTQPPLTPDIASQRPSFDAAATLAQFMSMTDTDISAAASQQIDTGRLTASLDIVTKNITANGLKVDNIAANKDMISLMSDVSFFGTPYFNSDTAGMAKIKQGDDQVAITFNKDYQNPPVVTASLFYADAQSAQSYFASDIRYTIINIDSHGFKIILNAPAPSDISFNWVALAINNAKTFNSQTDVAAPVQQPSPPDTIAPVQDSGQSGTTSITPPVDSPVVDPAQSTSSGTTDPAATSDPNQNTDQPATAQ